MKTKMFINITVFLLTAVTALAVLSCSKNSNGKPVLEKDREGNPISLPGKIERIISMGPSNAEILVALGLGGKIIAVDTYSENVGGIKPGIPMFNMMAPDGEKIVDLQPDVIFVTGMSKADGEDPFQAVANAGICIIYIPASTSIEGIKEDIRYIAAVTGTEAKGSQIISDMEKEIDDIKKTAAAITVRKTVYFEIEAAPYIYSFGTGVFLNEMIELIGARNILAAQQSWLSVADEAVVYANPDVILTSVDYIDAPVDEIKSRPGWNVITAVRNNEVYYIDTDSSNRPSHNIIKALKEMARSVYPDKY